MSTKNTGKNTKPKWNGKANLILWKPGQSGNPAGRRKGQRDYKTLFWIALNRIAEANGIEPEEVEDMMHAKASEKAAKGDFFFYQELNNRVHGKVVDKMDVTSGGKTLTQLITAAHASRKKTK